MTSVLSPSTTSVLGTSVPPSVPTGKESYALGVKLPLVGTKWAKLEEVMKNIPDNLEAKYYAYSSTTLLRGEKCITSYNNTNTLLLSKFRTPEATTHLKYTSPTVTSTINEPWIVSLHEDGQLQMYNIETDVWKKYQLLDPTTTNVKQYLCIIFNEFNLFLVSSSKLLHYEIHGMELNTTVRELTPDGTQIRTFGTNPNFSHILNDSLTLVVGGNFEFHIIDVGDYITNKPKVLGTTSTQGTQAAFLFVECSSNAVFAATRTTYYLWSVRDGSATLCVEHQLEQEVVVTAVFVDDEIVAIGKSNGVVSILLCEDGKHITDLNLKNHDSSSSDTSDPDWDENITKIHLSTKVNCIKRLGKWLICGYHNGRAAVFNLQKRHKKEPTTTFEYPEGHIKSLTIENSLILMLANPIIKKKKKKHDEQEKDNKKAELLIWVPAFKKKEDNKEFDMFSEVTPQVVYSGRMFDRVTKKIKKLAHNPEGFIYSLQHDNSIFVWNPQSGRIIHNVAIPASLKNAKVIHFKWYQGLLLIGYNNCLQTFNTKSLEWVHTFAAHTGVITDVLLDGKYMYTVSEDGHSYTWDLSLKSSEPLYALQCHPLPINCGFLHEGLLYTGSDDKTVKSFTIKDWKYEYGELRKLYALPDAVTDIAVLTENYADILFTFCRDKNVRTIDKNTGDCLKIIPIGELPLKFNVIHHKESTVFMTHPHQLFSTRDYYCFSWNLTQSKQGMFSGHQGRVYLCRTAIANDKCVLFTASKDRTIRAWNADTEELIQTFYTHQSQVNDMLFFNDHFYSASENGIIVDVEWKSEQYSKTNTPPSATIIPKTYHTKALPPRPPTNPLPPTPTNPLPPLPPIPTNHLNNPLPPIPTNPLPPTPNNPHPPLPPLPTNQSTPSIHVTTPAQTNPQQQLRKPEKKERPSLPPLPVTVPVKELPPLPSERQGRLGTAGRSSSEDNLNNRQPVQEHKLKPPPPPSSDKPNRPLTPAPPPPNTLSTPAPNLSQRTTPPPENPLKYATRPKAATKLVLPKLPTVTQPRAVSLQEEDLPSVSKPLPPPPPVKKSTVLSEKKTSAHHPLPPPPPRAVKQSSSLPSRSDFANGEEREVITGPKKTYSLRELRYNKQQQP